MSYNTWHEYGYGICVDDIDNALENSNMDDVEMVSRLNLVLDLAPQFKETFYEWVEESEIERDFYSLTDYEDNMGYKGLGIILHEVINEHWGIDLVLCDDYDGRNYLIFEPIYPWSKYGQKYLNLSNVTLQDIFHTISRILYDEDIHIDYQSVENGG